MYQQTDFTSQSGPVYKTDIDSDTTALAGVAGKRRNVNGDGRINQLAAVVAASTSFQYILDMWEFKYSAAGGTGNYTSVVATTFPCGFGIGSLSFGTTGAITGSFRTKIPAENVRDFAFAPYLYPVSAPAHPFASVGALAFQDTGVDILVTPTLFSCDVLNVFSATANSLVGPALTLPTGQVTQLHWDNGNWFQLDLLTNAANGLILQIDFALPAACSANKLILGDVQFEGGQACSFYGRQFHEEELRRCKRYYNELMSGVVNEGVTMIQASTTTTAFGVFRFPSEMFKTPVPVLSAASQFSVTSASGASLACTALTIGNATPRAAEMRPTVASGLVAGNCTELFANNTSARFALDARP